MAIELSRLDEFALITINRPASLNALSFRLIADLGCLIEKAAAGDARVLLITGAGEKAFCAGADVKELLGRSLMDQRSAAELGHATFSKLDRLPMPYIAVINGYALRRERTSRFPARHNAMPATIAVCQRKPSTTVESISATTGMATEA